VRFIWLSPPFTLAPSGLEWIPAAALLAGGGRGGASGKGEGRSIWEEAAVARLGKKLGVG
jgi:hypothetical protein